MTMFRLFQFHGPNEKTDFNSDVRSDVRLYNSTLIPHRGMLSAPSMAVGTHYSLEQPLGAPPSPPGITPQWLPGTP